MAKVTPAAPYEPNINPYAPISPAQWGGGGGTGAGNEKKLPPRDPLPELDTILPDVPEAPYTPPAVAGDDSADRRQFEQGKVDAQREALIDIDALTAEYDKLLASLRGQYQTSETREEKERLRFILADIEAQYEAGVEAITSLYAETTARLNNQATEYRAGIEGRAQGIESAFTDLAAGAVDRNLASREGLAQDYRGLGVAAGYDPRDANTDFLASLAPIQGNYSRMMGESTASGIDFIAGIAEQQGIAQRGDLQRLAAVTRTSAIITHQQQVAARTQAERAAQRSDANGIRMAALAARSSAMDLNAKLMNQAIMAEQYVPGVNAQEVYSKMTALATQTGGAGRSPEEFFTAFNSQFGGRPPAEFIQMFAASYASAALNEMAILQDRINKLNDPVSEATLRAEQRIQELDDNLNRLGYKIVP